MFSLSLEAGDLNAYSFLAVFEIKHLRRFRYSFETFYPFLIGGKYIIISKRMTLIRCESRLHEFAGLEMKC